MDVHIRFQYVCQYRGYTVMREFDADNWITVEFMATNADGLSLTGRTLRGVKRTVDNYENGLERLRRLVGKE